jgi:hypothetical protein
MMMLKNLASRRLMSAILFILVGLVSVACSSPDSAADETGEESRSNPNPMVATSDDGKLTLDIPAGSLSSEAEINISSVPLDELPDILEDISDIAAAYRMEPDGLEFNAPVPISLTFSSSELAGMPEDGVRAYALVTVSSDGEQQLLDNVVTRLSLVMDTVTISSEIGHFSYLLTVPKPIAVSMSDVAPQHPVDGTFMLNATISNDSKGKELVMIEVKGEFLSGGRVSAPGDDGFGWYDLFEGDEFKETQIFACDSTPGSGTYGVKAGGYELTEDQQRQRGDSRRIDALWNYVEAWIEGEVECVTEPPKESPTVGEPTLDELFALFPGSVELAMQGNILDDPQGDFIYEVEGRQPQFEHLPRLDIERYWAGRYTLSDSANQTAFGNTIFPCDTELEGRMTICPQGALPMPQGEIIMLGMLLAEEVALADPDNSYFYAVVFDSDGDPANNYQIFEPYNWDFLQGGDREYMLGWHPDTAEWTLTRWDTSQGFSALLPGSAARAVIDGRLVVFFIPVDEFEVSNPGYRLTTFGSGGTFEAEDSGGDVSGANPTEPLLSLPDEAIPIEELQDEGGG